MATKVRLWHSLRTKVTISILMIFLLSLSALSHYTNLLLREEITLLAGERQFSTVSLIAENINQELLDRRSEIEKIATTAGEPIQQGQPETLAFLSRHPVLQSRFNGGLLVYSADAIVMASSDSTVKPLELNLLENKAVVQAIKTAQPVIGDPAKQNDLKNSFFCIAAPVFDRNGNVIAVLAGIIDLSKHNFLEKVMANHLTVNGSNGNARDQHKQPSFLIMTTNRNVVMATDMDQRTTSLPPPQIYPLIDRFIEGYEGSMVNLSPLDVPVLASARRINATGWIVASLIPTEQAFAPINRIQKHMIWATSLLTVLAGLISWWILRRQLAPLHATAAALDDISENRLNPHFLSITRPDEIGILIKAFNRLLKNLRLNENALRQSEMRWKFAIEGSGSGLWDWDLRENTIFITKRWKEMLGYAEHELTGGLPEWKSLVHPDDVTELRRTIKEFIDKKLTFYNREYRLRCKDGSYRWILNRGMAVSRDAHGNPLRVIGTHIDITERKLAQDAIKASELRFRTMLLEIPSVSVQGYRQNGETHYWNQASEKLYGYTAQEAIGHKLTELIIPPQMRREVISSMEKMFRSGQTIPSEERSLQRKDGSPVEVFSSHILLTIPGQEPEMFCIDIDLTERKQSEVALLAAKAEAEKANRAKSHFLAAASHDLRQPLSALSLYVGLLKQSVSKENQGILFNIERCVDSLSELLSDLLDISKLDAGAITPKLSTFSIDQLLMTLVSVFSVEASKKNLQLRSRQRQLSVHTDPQLLKRIISNFLANAIRYTESGGALIACRRHEGKWWLEVWDTGIGFPKDQAEAIFEEFKQLGDDARNRGSGLGLSIARKMANLLGLKIRLNSRPGHGSMFALELPVSTLLLPESEPISGPPGEALCIGLVEDHSDILNALSMALESAGHTVIAAATGKRLMKKFMETPDTPRPDLIISDYRLTGGETGFDVIATVRSAYGENLPAIIITGDTDPALIRSMLVRSIAIQYKPLQIEALQATIKKVTQHLTKQVTQRETQ
jgi:PAS domain S-box-containing protein